MKQIGVLKAASHALVLRRQTAAQYLGTALRTLFPHAHLIGGEGTSRFFYYDVGLPFPFQKEMLPLIEEQMRRIAREKWPVKLMEMMPLNAAGLFDTQDQPLLAERLKTVDAAVVPLCQIGDFIDYCPHPFSVQQMSGFFKLIEGFYPHGQGVVRIVGALEEDKQTLKQVAKCPLPSSRNHLAQLETLFLPVEDFWVWLPKAEALREPLIAWWYEEHRREHFRFLSSHSAPLKEIGRAHLFKTAEIISMSSVFSESAGLFTSGRYFTDRAYLPYLKEKLVEEVISSLQFILKIPKILGFEFEILLSVPRADRRKRELFRQSLEEMRLEFTETQSGSAGARIEVQLFDSLGRKWGGPFLECPSAPEDLLVRSTFGSMERMIGLILEKGDVPLESVCDLGRSDAKMEWKR